MGFFSKWARLFNLGNSGRAVYEKPLGPRSNPLTDINGNGGIQVQRTMYSLKPAIALIGNTLTTNSPAGIASQVGFSGMQITNLVDPNAMLDSALTSPVGIENLGLQ